MIFVADISFSADGILISSGDHLPQDVSKN